MAMQIWDYYVLDLKIDITLMSNFHRQHQDELDKQGSEGWELVAVTTILNQGKLFETFYFKRPHQP